MPAIDRTSGVPAYRQIAEQIRGAIDRGMLQPDDLLLSETELMALYDVSRDTARKAVELLEQEGKVMTVHGKGSYVRRWEPWEYMPARHLTKHGDEPRATWSTEAERQGRDVVMEILGIHVHDDPPADIGEVLPMRPLLCRHKREWVDGVPIAVYESWFGWGTVAGTALEEMEPVPGGMLDYIEEGIGLSLARFREHLSVRQPTPEEQSALQLGPGVPVLVVRSVAYMPYDAPIHVDLKVIAGNAVELVYELSAHEA